MSVFRNHTCKNSACKRKDAVCAESVHSLQALQSLQPLQPGNAGDDCGHDDRTDSHCQDVGNSAVDVIRPPVLDPVRDRRADNAAKDTGDQDDGHGRAEEQDAGRGRFSVSFQVGLYFNRHSVLNFLKEP